MVFYKSNQKNKRSRTDIASDMSPSLADFKHELVKRKKAAGTNDILYIATEASSNQIVDDKSIPCFVRTGNESTSENDSRLDALEKAFRRQDAEIQGLKKEIQGLKQENGDLRELHKRQADSLTEQASAIKGLKEKIHLINFTLNYQKLKVLDR